MPNLKPLMKQRFIITVAGGAQSLTFDKLSAPEKTKATTDYNDGVQGQTKTAVGFMKVSNVTFSKTADEETDTAFRSWLESQGDQPFEIQYQAVTVNVAGDTVASYNPITITGCQVVRCAYPEVDRTSSDLAIWEVEVAVNGDIK